MEGGKCRGGDSHTECMESGYLTQTLQAGKEVSQGQGHPCCSEGLLGVSQMKAIKMKKNELQAEGRTWAKITEMIVKMCLYFRNCAQVSKH